MQLPPNLPRYRFDDLRNDRVSETAQAVCPIGNPISHSTQSGFSGGIRWVAVPRPRPPSCRTASVSDTPGFAALAAVFRDPLDFASPAVGVGQVRDDPQTFPTMRCADVASRQHRPFPHVPERGQVTDDTPECFSSVGRKQPWDIFSEDPCRTANGNESMPRRPKIALDVVGRVLPAGGAERLAGESAAPEFSVGERVGVERSDVSELRHVGPMAFENRSGEAICFDLADADVPGAFKSDVEPADAGEEGKESHNGLPLSAEVGTVGQVPTVPGSTFGRLSLFETLPR